MVKMLVFFKRFLTILTQLLNAKKPEWRTAANEVSENIFHLLEEFCGMNVEPNNK